MSIATCFVPFAHFLLPLHIFYSLAHFVFPSLGTFFMYFEHFLLMFLPRHSAVGWSPPKALEWVKKNMKIFFGFHTKLSYYQLLPIILYQYFLHNLTNLIKFMLWKWKVLFCHKLCFSMPWKIFCSRVHNFKNNNDKIKSRPIFHIYRLLAFQWGVLHLCGLKNMAVRAQNSIKGWIWIWLNFPSIIKLHLRIPSSYIPLNYHHFLKAYIP